VRRDRLRYVARDAVGPYDIVPLTLPGLRVPQTAAGVWRRWDGGRPKCMSGRQLARTGGSQRKWPSLGHGASRI